MQLDETDWYPEKAKTSFAKILRYQMLAVQPAHALLRIQAAEGESTSDLPQRAWVAQIGLSADECRALSEHLRQVADLLDAGSKPRN